MHVLIGKSIFPTVAFAVLAIAACTERNPAYVEPPAAGDGLLLADGWVYPPDGAPSDVPWNPEDGGRGDRPRADMTRRDGPNACQPGYTPCRSVCVNLQTDPRNCGACDRACRPGESCSSGICCPASQTNCSGRCTSPQSDPANCGTCGRKCGNGETCQGGQCRGGTGCADNSDEQTFDQGMRGCSGRVRFADRANLCASGFRPCTAQEWVSRRNGRGPSYIYWTDDNLRYNGSSGSCWVSTTTGTMCSGGAEPMRVCSGPLDWQLNACNWTNCGLTTARPNEYFGGCQNNPTAGTLCCPR